MHVQIWMSKNVISITPKHTIASAQQLFADNKIRRLPIVDNEILVGVLSRGDIEKALPSILDADAEDEAEYLVENTPVETIMTQSPVTVCPENTIVDAAKMHRNKIDGLPVVNDGSLVGVISITDILGAFLEISETKGGGTRFDLKISHDPEMFYTMVNIFKRYNKEIVAITQHHGFSPDNQLITLQTSDDDNEELLADLWKNEITVERVTPNNE